MSVRFGPEQLILKRDQRFGIAENLLFQPAHLLAQCLQPVKLAAAELIHRRLVCGNTLFAFLFLGTLLGLKLRLQFGALCCCHFRNIHTIYNCVIFSFRLAPQRGGGYDFSSLH